MHHPTARSEDDGPFTRSAQSATALRDQPRSGKLSGDGKYQTTPADVDAIFEEHLPAALATMGNGPLPLVLYAHGGLVSETSGLQIAHGQVSWWRSNGVYPVHFVWETGFLDALTRVAGQRFAGLGMSGKSRPAPSSKLRPADWAVACGCHEDQRGKWRVAPTAEPSTSPTGSASSAVSGLQH